MPPQWRRRIRWAVLGTAAFGLMSAGGDQATAGSQPEVPANSWTAATWHDSTPEERRGYILGITEGLRLATVFDRAEVDRSAVMACTQQRDTERLRRRVERYLDQVSHLIDESTLPFHVWDALVATCLDDVSWPGADSHFWVFVTLRHPVRTSRPYLSQLACESARHTRDLTDTTGCHRKPVSASYHRPIVPTEPRVP